MTHAISIGHAPVHPSDASAFQRELEERLAEHFGRPRPIVSLARRPSPYTSSFAIEELDVALDDGAELQLVMKDLSPDAMEEGARRVRPDFLYEPRREIHVYRRILTQAPEGTAMWYGVNANRRARRYQLFLERVDGLELRHVGAFSIWEQTAAWIARFHRVWPAQGEALASLAYRSRLLVYDEQFYGVWMERALQFAAKRPATRRVLERIAAGYGAIVDRLSRLPRTVIHGELYPCNVLIHTTRDRVRICPIDWEMAAYGPGLMDLASLTTGWDPRAQHALLRAYRAALAPEDARPPRELRIDLDCCRLHLALRMLGWSKTWAPPPQHAHNWLAEATRLAETLQL
jgi:hypothetical protein